MRTKELFPAAAVLLILTAGCQAREPERQSSPSGSTSTPAPASTEAQAPPLEAPSPPPPPPAATPSPQGATPAAAPAAALASQTSNWPGVVVDITEFRRKGSTLTARVVLRNQGSAEAEPDVHYDEVYVMDLAAGKKYEVLKDEKGTYIAALRSGWNNRWYQKLAPGETYTLWMKFPAPPPDVKAVTLQLPGLPPFEDLAIQDS
jgi:archaellum component FlaF (FlaF/FlaG flagellin family)